MGKANPSDRVIALESSAEATRRRWYEGSTTRALMMQCWSGRYRSRADLKSVKTLCDRSSKYLVLIPPFLPLTNMSGRKAYWVSRTCSSLICVLSSGLNDSAIQPRIWFEVSVSATMISDVGSLQREEMVSPI